MIFRCLLLLLLLCGPLRAEPPAAVAELRGEKLTLRLEGVPESHRSSVEDILREQLGFSPDDGPGAPLADDLAFFARQHLITHGWPDADVTWTLEADAIRLTFQPGQPLLTGQITWTGDTSPVPTDELEALLLRPLHEEHGKDRAKLPWVSGSVQSGMSLVVRRLQAEGYLSAAAQLQAPLPQTGSAWTSPFPSPPGPARSSAGSASPVRRTTSPPRWRKKWPASPAHR